MEAQEILVIILSSALAVFLVLGIVLLVMIIQIVGQVKRATTKAEAIIETAGEAIDQIHNASTMALVGNIINRFTKSAFGKTKDKE